MNLLNNSRGGLTIISDPISANSHRIRLIATEKLIDADMVSINLNDPLPDDLLQLNPSGVIPTLFDRDLILYDNRVMSEYLDERFPHPALMPIDPMTRAKIRFMIYRVESDWYPRVEALESGKTSANKQKVIIKELKESIALTSPLFKQDDFLLSDAFSLLDCAVLPILWRLDHFGITLPDPALKNIKNYMKDMFAREGFKKSLSEYEVELRK